MIRREGSYRTEMRENMRGGQGKIKIEHLWQPEEMEHRARLFARLTIEPECGIGFHEHLGEAEVFVVISGQAKMMDHDQEVILRAGDTILTSESGHAVEAIGDQPLIMLAVILNHLQKENC